MTAGLDVWDICLAIWWSWGLIKACGFGEGFGFLSTSLWYQSHINLVSNNFILVSESSSASLNPHQSGEKCTILQHSGLHYSNHVIPSGWTYPSTPRVSMKTLYPCNPIRVYMRTVAWDQRSVLHKLFSYSDLLNGKPCTKVSYFSRSNSSMISSFIKTPRLMLLFCQEPTTTCNTLKRNIWFY